MSNQRTYPNAFKSFRPSLQGKLGGKVSGHLLRTGIYAGRLMAGWWSPRDAGFDSRPACGPLTPKFGIKEGRLKNEDKVKQIIADQFLVDVDDVTPGSNLLDDLGADSLDVIELVMQFEDAFDIEIADEDAENIKTVKDVLDYIETKV